MIKETFLMAISSLQAQSEKDQERAELLSQIYGKDIDPIDNSVLSDAIFEIMKDTFVSEQMQDIFYFCYDQRFGTAVNKSAETLWQELQSPIKN